VLGRARKFYRTHSRKFAAGYTLLIILVWVLGPVAANLLSTSQSFLVSFGVLIVSLATILDVLETLARPNTLFIHHDQANDNQQLITLLQDKQLHTVHMIEYDSESTKELIFFFLRQGAYVHCLLQHPDDTINDSQRRRTVLQVKTRNEEYSEYLDQIRFSYYHDQASLRARKIDNKWLSFGIYTYDRRNGEDEGPQLWGHNNPVILTDVQQQPGAYALSEFFDRIFSNLLANSQEWGQVSAQYELYINRSRDRQASELVRMQASIAHLAAQAPELDDRFSLTVLRPSEFPTALASELLPVVASAFDDRHWDRRSVEEAVLSPATVLRVIVMRQADQYAGIATLHRCPEPSQVKLHWLAVPAAFRSQGVGAALIIEAARQAASDGFTDMVLRTESYRVPTLVLCERLGFYKVDSPISNLSPADVTAVRLPES
jgi:GNAT superfamily N-acetyltransferase